MQLLSVNLNLNELYVQHWLQDSLDPTDLVIDFGIIIPHNWLVQGHNYTFGIISWLVIDNSAGYLQYEKKKMFWYNHTLWLSRHNYTIPQAVSNMKKTWFSIIIPYDRGHNYTIPQVISNMKKMFWYNHTLWLIPQVLYNICVYLYTYIYKYMICKQWLPNSALLHAACQ